MKSKLFRLFALLMVASLVFTSVAPASAQSGVSGNTDNAVAVQPETPTTPAKIGISETGLYIVRLHDPALASYQGGTADLAATSPIVTGARKLDVNSAASRAYVSYLEAKQDKAVSEMETTLGHPVEVAYRYINVLNGLAVRVSHAEALKLAALPTVKAVYPDTLREPDTDVGPWWIGADAIWDGTIGSGVDTKGEGVLIGVIDSGVNHAHPSFADVGGDGYDHTNPWGAGVYHGVCKLGDPNYIADFCNDKLISAFSFYPGVVSPEDLDGHGSHTASTSGGNNHVMTLTVGTSTFTRTISGVAPHANLAIYKVCSPSCPGTASIAATNQGITDGVDVLNYSISGGDDPWNDPVDLAFLDAFNAGIFVSASAGNSGPGANTVAKTGPWNASVANTTLPRMVANSLDVTDPVTTTLQDIGALQGDGPNLATDMEREISDYPANPTGCTATGGIPAGTFTNQIALIVRGGCTFAEKSTNAAGAGAVAVVIYNNRGGPPIAMSVGGTVPSVMINQANGLALVDYIADNAPVTARLNAAASVIYDVNDADIVAGGSSRGPSDWELLKPDYGAPGTNILAAVAQDAGDPLQYDFYSGTSMAAPHGAGSAALMIALHPTWSPAEVKSALQTTTFPWYAMRAETATSVDPAKPFDAGSGRLDLESAANAGLVFDETYADYVAANPTAGGDVKVLNQSSLVNYDCVGTCSWTRTVESVLPVPATYTVTFVTTHPTLTVTANPAVFTINPGATRDIVFTANVTGMPLDIFAFGDVVFETDATFLGTTVLSEGFESATFPPAGWASYDVDGDAGGTEWVTTTVRTHSGSTSAFHSYDSGAPAEDGWLRTPQIALPAGAQLTFWESVDYAGDYNKHSLLVCTSGCDTPPTNYTEVTEFDTPAEDTWTPRSADLSAYGGQSVYLAIRYEGENADDWYIDDLSIAASGMAVSDQRLTTIVAPASAFVPGQVNVDTDAKMGMQLVEDLQVAAPVVTFTYSIDGLDLGDVTTELVPQDPTTGLPYNGDGGVLTKTFTVPAGALRLVVEVAESTSQDVDLWVGTGTTLGAGVVCTSATGAVLEYCEIDNPAAGAYWAVAQNYLASAPGAEDPIVLSVGVVTPGDSGNAMFTGPSSVPAGMPFDVTLHWDEPTFAGEQRWYGVATFGTSPATPDDIGQMNINLAYHQPAYIIKDAPDMAEPGEVIPYTIVLDGMGNLINQSAVITDLLPAGVEYAGGLSATAGNATYDAGDNAVYWDYTPGQALYSNGPLITHPGAGTGGADVSRLQSGLGMTTLGAGNQASAGNSVADDFIVPPGGWDIGHFTFYAYQTGSTTASTITGLAYRIWNGDPTLPASQIIYGSLVTDTLVATGWSGIYRDAESSPGATNRPIMASHAGAGIFLPAGTYWIEWITAGSLASGPWAPPITILGQTTTGNAYQNQNGTWVVLNDGGTLTQQGLPFEIVGTDPEVITITFNVTVTAALGDIITNTVNFEYAGDDFSAEAVTLVDVNEVTFVYHDLEDVVAVGEGLKLAGDFTGWGTNPISMTHDAAYDVFTATVILDAGSYGYKYIVVSGGDQWDWLNTGNRTVNVTGDQTVHDYRNVTVGYAVLSAPAAITITLGQETGIITGQVYIQNVTNPAGMGDYHAQLGYGMGSDLNTWTWVEMDFAGQVGNNDVVTGIFTPTQDGVFMYAVRFDGNWATGNPNKAWTYGDLDGVYPGEPFELENTGDLTVLPLFKLYLPLIHK